VADQLQRAEQRQLTNARRLLLWGTPALGLLLWPPLMFLCFEEILGLEALFAWRGEVDAPEGVLVVAIDEETSDLLNDPDRRARYADLIGTLCRRGASVVVLDIFVETPTESDSSLAQTLGECGNVLLATRLDDREMAVRPIVSSVSRNALGVATVPVPTGRSRVDWVPLRYELDGETHYTMPMLALQGYLYDDFIALLNTVRPDAGRRYPAHRSELRLNDSLSAVIAEFSELFANDSQLGSDMRRQLDGGRSGLRSLVSVYADQRVLIGNRMYVNYYGVPRTVPTASFDDVLSGRLDAFDGAAVAGKAVFVGYSARRQQGERDAYPYVFSLDGLDLAGVELGATVFANLLHGEALRLPSATGRTAVAVIFGVAMAACFSLLRARLGIVAVMFLGAVYLTIVRVVFEMGGIWLPIVLPAIQVAFAGLASLRVRQLHERVVLGRGTAREAALALTGRGKAEKVDHRVILYADQKGSTAWLNGLQERLDEKAYRKLEREYVQKRDGPIALFGGELNHGLADSMLIFWVTPEDPSQAATPMNAACRTALAMHDGISDFNRKHEGNELPMRFGLDWGRIWSHLNPSEYIKDWRLVGTTVNLAARLESLNDALNTWILVSDTIADRIDKREFWVPRLGTFVFCTLGGMVELQPVGVHGLDSIARVGRERREAAVDLEAALQAVERQDWTMAIAILEHLGHESEFGQLVSGYLSWCRESQQEMPECRWRGLVRVTLANKSRTLTRYLD
jgi:adenylate cyclase